MISSSLVWPACSSGAGDVGDALGAVALDCQLLGALGQASLQAKGQEQAFVVPLDEETIEAVGAREGRADEHAGGSSCLLEGDEHRPGQDDAPVGRGS